MFGLFSDGEALGSFPQWPPGWLALHAKGRKKDVLPLANGEMKVSCPARALGRAKFTPLAAQKLQRCAVRCVFYHELSQEMRDTAKELRCLL